MQAGGLAVPDDRPLDDLTAELTTMLGSPDPHVRDGTRLPHAGHLGRPRACTTTCSPGSATAWPPGSRSGSASTGTDSVFRRSFSALVLAECIDRDNEQRLLPAGKRARAGATAIATWYLRERDLRGCVPGKGWAHTVAHGADAIGVLARSPHLAAAPSSPCCST